jgi:hypothetical protein
LDLPNLTFQIIRRTMATLSQTKGGPKATQGMLRHSRTPTTTDTYQQIIPEEVQKMIDSVHDDLRKPSSAAGKLSENAAKFRSRRKRSSN